MKQELQSTFGSPPVPSAMSKAKEPVETTGTFLGDTERPSHIIDPFPKELVIWSRACFRAKSFLDIFSSQESLPSDLGFLLPSSRHKSRYTQTQESKHQIYFSTQINPAQEK